MRNIDLIRNMKDQQLTEFLTKVSTQQDFYDKVSNSVCAGICSLSGEQCPMHTEDDSCPCSPTEVIYQWLNSDFRIQSKC